MRRTLIQDEVKKERNDDRNVGAVSFVLFLVYMRVGRSCGTLGIGVNDIYTERREDAKLSTSHVYVLLF